MWIVGHNVSFRQMLYKYYKIGHTGFVHTVLEGMQAYSEAESLDLFLKDSLIKKTVSSPS